jgi:mannose-6-phosphate isomerase-like protein (cupin superfamily)
VGYSKLNIQDVEGAGPGGAFHFVRRELGVLAFGVNWIELPPGTEGHEHDESASEQEEVHVVVAGSGVYRIDGEELTVGTGDFLRFDPETTRCPIAGSDGLTLVAIGAPRGAYEPRGRF